MLKNLFVISPHIDDAIFSLGGLISKWQEMEIVTVVNVFSRTNFANGTQISEGEATKTRKNEDNSVQRLLPNVTFIYLELPEALLRGMRQQEIFLEDDMLSSASLTPAFLLEMEAKLRGVIPYKSSIFAPSGFGGHVDHLLVREASLSISESAFFYADLPYFGRLERQENATEFLKNKTVHVEIAKQELVDRHCELCDLYGSQILERHKEEIRNNLQNKGFIYWS